MMQAKLHKIRRIALAVAALTGCVLTQVFVQPQQNTQARSMVPVISGSFDGSEVLAKKQAQRKLTDIEGTEVSARKKTAKLTGLEGTEVSVSKKGRKLTDIEGSEISARKKTAKLTGLEGTEVSVSKKGRKLTDIEGTELSARKKMANFAPSASKA